MDSLDEIIAVGDVSQRLGSPLRFRCAQPRNPRLNFCDKYFNSLPGHNGPRGYMYIEDKDYIYIYYSIYIYYI